MSRIWKTRPFREDAKLITTCLNWYCALLLVVAILFAIDLLTR